VTKYTGDPARSEKELIVAIYALSILNGTVQHEISGKKWWFP
jgi:hypothetical protein